MPTNPSKTIKEIVTDIGGNTTIEFSDDSLQQYNIKDVVTSVTNPLTGGITFSKAVASGIQDVDHSQIQRLGSTLPLNISHISRVKRKIVTKGLTGTWNAAAVGFGMDVVWDHQKNRYAMLTNGRKADGSFSVGMYTSKDLVTWTEYVSNPVLSPAASAGWDFGSVGVRTVIWSKAEQLWHLFYEGFPAPGYEQGASKIGHATASVLEGPWSRDPANPIIKAGDFPELGTNGILYLPCVVEQDGTYYAFFNGAITPGDEDCYYSTAPSLWGPWTPRGVAVDNASVGGGIVADPWVFRMADRWYLMSWNSAGGVTNLHYSDKLDGPWIYHGNVTTRSDFPGYRPTVIQVGRKTLIFMHDVSATWIDLYGTGSDEVPLLSHTIHKSRFQLDCGEEWGSFDLIGTGGARRLFSSLNTGGALATLGVAYGASGSETEKPILVMPTTLSGDPYLPVGFRLMTATGPLFKSGAGTPEGVLTAPIGSIWTRTDGGAGATLYVKESGVGNTGWIAK